jgi:predicted phosphodiesterase
MDITKKPSGSCFNFVHSREEIEKKEYLLISDVHFDNVKCNRDLFKKHLDQAKARDAGVLIFGDFFCAMQGRNDRRSSKSDLRDENNRTDYLDSLVESAVEYLTPYRDNILLVTRGNHETSVLSKLETDLTRRLALGLGSTQYGPYQGYIRFQFNLSKTSRRTTTMFYHHGAFTGVITKGALSVARYAAIAPDADIIVSGHTHDRWVMEHPQYRLSKSGEVSLANQLHVKTGTYKEEYLKGDGWATERIVFPKSLGGWWLSFELENEEVRPHVRMT